MSAIFGFAVYAHASRAGLTPGHEWLRAALHMHAAGSCLELINPPKISDGHAASTHMAGLQVADPLTTAPCSIRHSKHIRRLGQAGRSPGWSASCGPTHHYTMQQSAPKTNEDLTSRLLTWLVWKSWTHSLVDSVERTMTTSWLVSRLRSRNAMGSDGSEPPAYRCQRCAESSASSTASAGAHRWPVSAVRSRNASGRDGRPGLGAFRAFST